MYASPSSITQPSQLLNGQAAQSAELAALLDLCFGADRQRKTSYKLRDGQAQIEDLWFTVQKGGKLVASIQYWPIAIRSAYKETQALLLGPLAVHPDVQGEGLGRALLDTSISVASLKGHVHILLVGDPAYYGRRGFSSKNTSGLSLPGPYDPKRLLHRQIAPGPMLPFSGLLSPAFPVPGEGKKAEQQQKGEPGWYQLDLNYAQNTPGVVAL